MHGTNFGETVRRLHFCIRNIYYRVYTAIDMNKIEFHALILYSIHARNKYVYIRKWDDDNETRGTMMTTDNKSVSPFPVV